MRILVACKRGNIADRDRFGHCLCADCKAFRYARQRVQNVEYKRAWLRAHPEKTKEYSARWVAAHPERRSATVRSWRERNPDKVAAMSAKAGAKWAANHKGQRNASVKARQLAKRQRMPAWADLAAIQAFYVEAARLTRESGIPHEVDHIIPLQGELVSGLHVDGNLRVITRSANRSKRNRYEGGPCVF